MRLQKGGQKEPGASNPELPHGCGGFSVPAGRRGFSLRFYRTFCLVDRYTTKLSL